MVAPSRYELPSEQDGTAKLARILRQTRQGKLNTTHEITLVNGTTETVVRDNDIGPSTVAILIPQGQGAAEVKWWMSTRGKGFITIGHDDPGQDRTLALLLIG